MISWRQWCGANWFDLVDGQHLDIEPGTLPHPNGEGFEPVMIAEPFGQDEDWARSLADGSRIHVHRWNDGRMRAHRDLHDPARGIVPAVRHFLTEAPSAKVALIAGVGAVALKAVRRVLVP